MLSTTEMRNLKSIAAHVEDGIGTIDDLKAALQTAVQLEFATIPPYLAAQWSIKGGADPDKVAVRIGAITLDEMFHFGIAGNILTAIGGMPTVASEAFLPAYPTNILPGGIAQALPVDIQPLSAAQLDVFMQIEKPAFSPVAIDSTARPATIGDFYETISQALTDLQPTFDPQAKFLLSNSGRVGPITTLNDALAGIARIKEEGEGTEDSPDQPPAVSTSPAEFAHYYQFKEVRLGRRLQQTDGQWAFDGPAIAMPEIFDFAPGPVGESQAFVAILVELLTELQGCWLNGGKAKVGLMFELADEGRRLIEAGRRPEFLWAS